MIRSRYMFLIFFLIFAFILKFEVSAESETLQWIDLTSDYFDTDGDGEHDDYLSYQKGDDIFVVDRLDDFQTILGSYTILTLRSDPDNTSIFGNTLDSQITTSNMIMMNIRIIESTELDGEYKETYEIQSVRIFYTENGDDDNDDDDSDSTSTFSTILLFCGICCLPSIVATVISTLIRSQAKKKKENEESSIYTDTNYYDRRNL